jgi:hypothetical protein
LIISYHLLQKPDATFQDLGGDCFLTNNSEQEPRRAIKTLRTLAFEVSLTPATACNTSADLTIFFPEATVALLPHGSAPHRALERGR